MAGIRQRQPVQQPNVEEEVDRELSPMVQDRDGKFVRLGTTEDQASKKFDIFTDPVSHYVKIGLMEIIYIPIIKITKVLAYIITFILVLGGAVLAKSSLLLMTSQLEINKTVPYCSKNFGRYTTFEAKIPEVEGISWTWVILFSMIVPEILTIFRSMRIGIFKGWHRPSPLEFFAPFIFETCHAMGVSLFVFIVLPSLDVLQGAMVTNCVCLVPAILSLIQRISTNLTETKREAKKTAETEVKEKARKNSKKKGKKNGEKDSRKVKIETNKWKFLIEAIDMFSVIFQLSGLTIWTYLNSNTTNKLWMVPISGFLISCGWWENYLQKSNPLENFTEFKWRLRKTRYFTYLLIAPWKIFVYFYTMFFSVWFVGDDARARNLFGEFYKIFDMHDILVSQTRTPATERPISFHVLSSYGTLLLTLGVQIFAAYICFITAKFACRVIMQRFSFAFALSMVVPVTVLLLTYLCGMRSEDTCFWHDTLPGYIFWNCPKGDFVQDFLLEKYAWMWVLWLTSQIWITAQIWDGASKYDNSTEDLFISPMYTSALVDQSLTLNRRIGYPDKPKIKTKGKPKKINPSDLVNDDKYAKIQIEPSETFELKKNKDTVWPRIIACATLWHEKGPEMLDMLKSILKMDAHHNVKSIQKDKKLASGYSDDYYEYESHIFFDDAFIYDEDKRRLVNGHVKRMLENLAVAVCEVRGTENQLGQPLQIHTPYGGQLVYILPGKTKLVVHLKDNKKIRHRKRWSQVMYMYYLLGQNLMYLDDAYVSTSMKAALGENTFILALDGDIEFKPEAVDSLLDIMRNNKRCGAACGRIHPKGRGPMVWYQKFEYAIGHWFQKATEHVLGCVLCSPGCFSLFRANALMDHGVMKKYAKRCEKPLHYVQYDQGEDRWLCMLILQRGYRIEYCAASDAYTNAPESFSVFFNQRKRWVPSTMANIMDLLLDSDRTININTDISRPFIVYQGLLMFGSILGPGTIFLMLIGAFVAVFNISNMTGLLFNFIPIILFMIVCFFYQQWVQLMVAQLLSAIYAIVMVAVLVALTLQMIEDGLQAPTSIFFLAVAGSFIIAALFHPLEWDCLIHGLVYYLTIPSMYLLLIIYSLFNMNDVNWGTRDGDEQKKDDIKAPKTWLLSSLKPKRPGQAANNLVSPSFLTSVCCGIDRQPLSRIEDRMLEVMKKLDQMEQNRSENQSGIQADAAQTARTPVVSRNPSVEAGAGTDEVDEQGNSDDMEKKKVERERLMHWMIDLKLTREPGSTLTNEEESFWDWLIMKYLSPIVKTEEDKKKDRKSLRDLRDQVASAFIMINAIFVVAIFIVQLKKDVIHVPWPLDVKTNMTVLGSSRQILIQKTYLQLEPIGLAFVGTFGIILLVQFIAMVYHRFNTISRLWAVTALRIFERPNKYKKERDAIKNHQRKKDNNESETGTILNEGQDAGTRQIVKSIIEHANKRRGMRTVDRRFKIMINEDNGKTTRNVRRDALRKGRMYYDRDISSQHMFVNQGFVPDQSYELTSPIVPTVTWSNVNSSHWTVMQQKLTISDLKSLVTPSTISTEERIILERHAESQRDRFILGHITDGILNAAIGVEIDNAFVSRLNFNSLAFAASVVKLLFSPGRQSPFPKGAWDDYKFVFLPLHYDDHWKLLVVTPSSKRPIMLLDPSGSNYVDPRLEQSLLPFINTILGTDLKLKNIHTPARATQIDSYNCGIYVIRYVRQLLQARRLTDPFNPDVFRTNLLSSLWEHAVESDFLCH